MLCQLALHCSYIIYYLEMTWKTKLNHILSQSSMSMFNVHVSKGFCISVKTTVFKQHSWSFCPYIRNVLFCARAPSSFVYEWTHSRSWCLSEKGLAADLHSQTLRHLCFCEWRNLRSFFFILLYLLIFFLVWISQHFTTVARWWRQEKRK